MRQKVATQLSPRIIAARKNGALGGKARAKNNTKEKIKKWGAKGGKATLDNYGSEFFGFINGRAKTSGRYKTPRQQFA